MRHGNCSLPGDVLTVVPLEAALDSTTLQERVTRFLYANRVFSRKEFGAANRSQPIQLRWKVGTMAALGTDLKAKLKLGNLLPCPCAHLPATPRDPT